MPRELSACNDKDVTIHIILQCIEQHTNQDVEIVCEEEIGFLLYTNDLSNCLHPSIGVKVYADDTKLYHACSNSDVTPLSESLLHFYEWSLKWQLTVSVSKTNVFSFGNLRLQSEIYFLSGHPLDAVTIKDIKVHLSTDNKLPVPCAHLASKAYYWCIILLKASTPLRCLP